MANTKLVGENYSTPELRAKVTGRAKYAEDFRAEGMLFTRLVLSPYAHARIKRIDASAALAMPGVKAILTPDDVPGPKDQINDNGTYSSSSKNSTDGGKNSDIDYLNSLAKTLAPQNGNPPKGNSGTTSPAKLNPNLNTISNGNDGQDQNTGNTKQNGTNNQYVYPTVLPPDVGALNTFRSPNNSGTIPFSADPASPFQQFLNRLKGVLQGILVFLKPFGSHAPVQQGME